MGVGRKSKVKAGVLLPWRRTTPMLFGGPVLFWRGEEDKEKGQRLCLHYREVAVSVGVVPGAGLGRVKHDVISGAVLWGDGV